MKKRTLITKLTLLCVGLLFFASCSDLLGFQEGTSSARTGGNGKVIFNGTISVSGALPATLSHATESSHADDSRSALPSITIGDDYYYYVTATKTDGSETVSRNTPSEFDTTNGVTFALELPTGNWNIECGIKKAKTSGTTSENDLPVMSDTYPAPLTSANPVVNHTFYPKPSQKGSGKVALNISYESGTVNSVTAKCGNESWTVSTSGTQATIKMDAIASGTYDLSIYFYKNDGNGNSILVYSTVQTINVFDNMTTNTWVSDGSGLISDSGVFNLTSALITQFARTTFYVGSTSVGAASNDTGNGSPYAPFETVNKAVEVIAATGDISKDYRIYVSGTVTGAQKISEGVNSKANSITIQGCNGLDTSGVPKDALNGNNDGSSLTIDTSVPVTIKNLKITGGSGTAGGGIYVKSGSVTLSEGALITGNNADYGGGIYVESVATALIAGGEISANTANTYGGGIYNDGDVFVYGNSNFKNNSCTVSMKYGGAVYNLGNLYLGYSSASNKSEWKGEISGNSASSAGAIWSGAGAKVCFDSGTIKENSANWNGQNQSLFIMGTGVFEMGGSAYIASTDPVYLCAFGADRIISPVTITSALTAHSASDQIAITCSVWNWGTKVVKADGSNFTNVEPYKGCFTLTDKSWECKVTSDNQYLVLDAPIYVAGQTLSELIECTKVGNDTSGKGTKAEPFATIAKAATLMNSSVDYTIYIDGTLTGVQSISDSSIQANSITIQGTSSSATINGNNEGPALQLSEAINNITILKLNITNGKTGANGGGIVIPDDSNGVKTKVTLGDGTADNGVAIYENTAVNGGGIYIGSGNELTITNGCKIYNNTAIDEHPALVAMPSGGGIYSKSTINMSGGEIYGNKIDWDNLILAYGGGVCINGDDTVAFNFSGGRIYGNKARYGGGIYNGVKLFMSGSAVVGNKDKTSLVTETDIENGANYAIQGGGIYNTKDLYIGYTSESQKNTGFSGGIFFNYAGVDGGGVYNSGLTNEYLSSVKIAGGSIACNRAESGGAVCQGENSSCFEMGDYAYIPQDNACTNDIYLSSDKFITVNSQLRNTYYAWGQAKTVITHASPASDKKVLDGSRVSSLYNEYKYFSINSDSFYISSDGTLKAPEQKTASTLEELKTIVTSLTEGAGVEIDVTADITCSASWNDPVLKIPANATLILKSSGSKTIKCSTSANYSADPRLIELDKGAKLVLDGITLAGSSESTNFVRAVQTNSGGEIIMKGSTVIKDFYYSGLGTGLFYLSQGSRFTMQGGTISNCLAGRGGSVADFWKGIFNFYGGSITGCRSPFYFDVGGLVNWKKSTTNYDDYIETSLENNSTKVNIINE